MEFYALIRHLIERNMRENCPGSGPCENCFEEPARYHRVPAYVSKARTEGDMGILETNRGVILRSLTDLHQQRVKHLQDERACKTIHSNICALEKELEHVKDAIEETRGRMGKLLN